AQHRLVQAEAAIELLHDRARPLVEQQRVDPVAAAADLVRQAPLAPALHFEDLAAQSLDPLDHAVHFLVHLGFVQPRVEDDRRFVLGHGSHSSLGALRLTRFIAASIPSPIQHSTASAADDTAAATSSSSSSLNSSSTWSRSASLGDAPTPMRSRA